MHLSCFNFPALSTQHHQLLGIRILEAQLPVEAGALGGHQIHLLNPHHRWGVEQFFDHPAAKAVALQIAGHHDVPEHGPAEAIGGGAAEAHQPLAAPEAHHSIAAGQQTFQLPEAPAAGPEGVAIEQPLQLEQRPAGAQIRPEAQPTQAGGTGGMVNQPDRGHGSGSRSTSSCSPAIIDACRLASHPCPPTTSRLPIPPRVISQLRSSSWWRG